MTTLKEALESAATEYAATNNQIEELKKKAKELKTKVKKLTRELERQEKLDLESSLGNSLKSRIGLDRHTIPNNEP